MRFKLSTPRWLARVHGPPNYVVSFCYFIFILNNTFLFLTLKETVKREEVLIADDEVDEHVDKDSKKSILKLFMHFHHLLFSFSFFFFYFDQTHSKTSKRNTSSNESDEDDIGDNTRKSIIILSSLFFFFSLFSFSLHFVSFLSFL